LVAGKAGGKPVKCSSSDKIKDGVLCTVFGGAEERRAAGPVMGTELTETLKALGVELPSAWYLIGVLLFSVVGIVAFWKGRQLKRPPVKWLGLALMLYPYVVWSTAGVYVVGAGLCVALAVYWPQR
jgi:hypothetical protein